MLHCGYIGNLSAKRLRGEPAPTKSLRSAAPRPSDLHNWRILVKKQSFAHLTQEEAGLKKCVLTGLISLLLAGLAQGAAAQPSAPRTPWYVAGGFGLSEVSIPSQTLDATNAVISAGNGAAFTVTDRDDGSTGTKFLLGYRFNPNFAVEGGYATLGKASAHTDFRGGGSPSVSVGTFNLQYEMSGPFVDAVGILPLNDKWSLFGRIGVSNTKTSADIAGAPLTLIISSDDLSETKLSEKFGAGVDYNVNAEFGMRAEWERYKAPDPLSNEVLDVDMATVSFVYRF